jgi:hypothetical protein
VEGQDCWAATIADKSTTLPVAAVIAARVATGSDKAEDTWPALKVAVADPAGTFTAAAAEAGEGDDGEEIPPALEMAAADPVAAFTAAASKAGGDDDDVEELSPALKAATADPAGAFTAVAAEAGTETPGVADEKMMTGSRDRVSATTLLTPAMWRISEVYSATYDSWRACLGVHTLLRA